jgi:hypothetical protein
MSWFKVDDGRVLCSGQISRDPFTAWTVTPEGSAAVVAVAASMRFKLLGKARAARNRIWRQLFSALRSADGRLALQSSADLYVRSLTSLAYAQALPRTTVGLHRLVLVPRAILADRARAAISAQTCHYALFAERPAPERDFLIGAVMAQVDEAMRYAKPTSRKPVRGYDEWVVIGADMNFQWVDRYWSGDGWTGHWFLYERPRTGLSRADRGAIERAVEAMRASVHNLSRERRQALIKLATT